MEPSLHPELLDRLAASYALGSLRGGARRRMETLARRNVQVRASILLWQERLVSLTELQPGEQPGAQVWKRIEAAIARDRLAQLPSSAAPSGLPDAIARALQWWRGASLGAGAVALLAVGVALKMFFTAEGRGMELAQARQQSAALTAQLQARPEVIYVAVLSDQRAAASLLATADLQRGTLTVRRVGPALDVTGRVLELWSLPPQGQPRSLGLLSGEQVTRLRTQGEVLRATQALAVSLEPPGGAPAGSGPTGPVLLQGRLLQAGL